MTRKRIIILAVIGVLVLAVGGFLLWGYYHPGTQISVTKPADGGDSYFEDVFIIISPYFNMPLCPKLEKMRQDLTDAGTAFLTDIQHNYQKPYHITMEISEQDGKTILTRGGWATDLDGNRVDYHQVIELDWIFDEIENGDDEAQNEA